MSTSPDAPDLVNLDQAQPVPLDPRCWQGNLAALETRQPEFARRLASIDLPTQWRSVRALDGSVTFRVEDAGENPVWLGGTAAPRTRADALLHDLSAGSLNVGLPAIGAGALLTGLLARLAPHEAAFVFEGDIRQVAAVLRLADISADIRRGRCFFLTADDEAAELLGLLEQHSGLLPPGRMISPPDVGSQRVEALRAVCERAHHETMDRRQRLRTHLSETVHPGSAPLPATPRLAILALSSNRLVPIVSEGLHRAADALGWVSTVRRVEGPLDVDITAHCQAVAEFGPSMMVCVNHSVTRLPLPPPNATAEWYLGHSDEPAAAAPVLRLAVCATGGDMPVLPWAADEATLRGEAPEPGDTVVLVADLPDDTAAACGIDQPTHRALWEKLREAARDAWQRRQIASPEAVLCTAERAADVRIADEQIRNRMRQLVEHVLIPAAVVERIRQVLSQGPNDLAVIGKGWQRCNEQSDILGETPFDLSGPGRAVRPLMAVFAGRGDPLDAGLLHAAALGWPLAIHTVDRAATTKALSVVLRPERHYTLFGDAADLRATLQRAGGDRAALARRAARTRAHLLGAHTYRHRLQGLAARLGLGGTGLP